MIKHNNTVVAQVVQHLRPGGIETMVLDLLRHQSFRTVIFSLEGTYQQAVECWPLLAKHREHLVFLNKQPGYQWSLIWQLGGQFKRHGINAVHTHHIGPLLYGGLAARLSGIGPLVHTEHDAWHLDNLKRRWLQRTILGLIRPVVVADASAVASRVKGYLQHQDIRIIHNGIDLAKFKPGNAGRARAELNLPPGIMLIGSSGRLERVKGHDLLISALATLPSNVHLAIAGSGSCEALLRRQVTKLHIQHRVHFLGSLDNMSTFYQALDLFCLPSRSEGLPLAPLEAQACGIPSVVTNVGGAAEALCHQSGLLVEGPSVEQLISALEMMLRRIASSNPREFVQQHRNVKDMAAAYARLIDH